MGIFGGVEVDLRIELADGRLTVTPGEAVRGVVTFTAREPFEARGILASLTGTEEHAYEETERTARGDSRVDREWQTDELHREESMLASAGRVEAGEARTLPFEFRVPSDGPPSFESGVLRVRWRVAAWIDVGGRDPRVEQELVVPLLPDAVATTGGDDGALALRFDGEKEGAPFSITLDDLPLVPGAPFRGRLETADSLDPERVRAEVKLTVTTAYGHGPGFGVEVQLPGGLRLDSRARRAVSETTTIWQGAVARAADGPGYAFEGVLPSGPVATIRFPHGHATAAMDIVVDRRMRPDEHYARPVAIASRG